MPLELPEPLGPKLFIWGEPVLSRRLSSFNEFQCVSTCFMFQEKLREHKELNQGKTKTSTEAFG